MKLLAKIITKYAMLFILLNLGTTAFFAIQLPKITTNNEMESFVPADHPVRILNNYLKEIFGDNREMILAIEAKQGTIIRETILKRIGELTEELEMLDNVDEVTSLANVDNILGVEDGMQVDPIFDPYDDINSEVLTNVKTALDSWSFYKGNMINSDYRATAIAIEFPKNASNEIKADLYSDIKKLLSRFSFPEVNLYLAGSPVAEVELSSRTHGDMRNLVPFVMGVIALSLLLFFRSVLGVVLPLICIIMSTTTTMGLMALLGVELSFLGTVIPTVLVAIASAYSIHMIHHFNSNRNLGLTSKEAIEKAFENAGFSIVLTGLTTMAGFGSLATSSVGPIKDFGIFIAIGTGAAVIVAFTFIPPVLLFFVRGNKTVAKTDESSIRDHRGISFILYKVTGRILRYYKQIVLTGFILVIVCICISLRIQSFTDMRSSFPPDSKMRIAADWINDNFTGTSGISVIITGKRDSIKKPEVLKQIDDLQHYVENKYSYINKSVSIVDFVKRMNVAMHANNPEYDKIPPSSELVAQYLLLYSTSGEPDDFDPYVDYDYKEARIRFQSTRSRTTDNNPILASILEYAKNNMDPELKVQVSGQAAIYSTLNELIIIGQITSVVASMGIVLIIMMCVYRSIAGGILSILPLSFAILSYFAAMGLLNIPLNIGTAIIASIAVGVGIDYAIHYVNNARKRAGYFNSLDELYLYTAVTSGTAIIYNALAVAAGFLVLLYSNLIPLRRMGGLVALTMITSAIGSLVFIPAILKMFKPKFIKLKQMNE